MLGGPSNLVGFVIAWVLGMQLIKKNSVWSIASSVPPGGLLPGNKINLSGSASKE